MNAFERLRNGGRAAGDEGFTLVELLVTMLITGIVLTMLGTFFANISRLTSWSGKDRDATGQAALALDAVRAVVRVATDNPSSPTTTDTAVQAGTGSQLSIIAYSNTSVNAAVPVLVTFTLSSSGDLTERRQLGALNPAGYYRFTGPITTSTVATGFQPAAANPFFTYLDRSSTKLPATGGLSATNRANVTFIQVTTTLDPQTAGGPDGAVVVTTSIGMPNLARDVAATVAVPNLPTPTETPTPTPTPTRVTPPPTSTPVSTPTPTTGSSGGSGTGTGSGSGTATPPASGGGGGSTGGGSGTSTPAPTSTTPKPTATATATPTPAPKPTATPKPPVVIDQ